jgi:PTS system mannose-specific IIA component
MIGIVLMSHGKFADGLYDSVKLIFGEVANIKAVSLLKGQNIEDFKKEVVKTLDESDTGDGALALVDLFGASPCNASMFAQKELKEKGKKIKIVTGMNLAMVLETIGMRDYSSLDELAKIAINCGREGIQEPTVVESDEGDDY